MEIKQFLSENKGFFYVEDDHERLATMTYTMSGPTKMIIQHTEVSEKMGGKGVGKQLVAKAVEYARTNHLKILPLCPFAKAILEKVPAYSDVLF